MPLNISIAATSPEEQRQDEIRPTAPLLDASGWPVNATDVSYTMSLPDLNQVEPQAAAIQISSKPQPAPVVENVHGMTTGSPAKHGPQRSCDATTQTTTTRLVLEDDARARLVAEGTKQAHKYMLQVYGELQFAAVITRGPEAARLATRADIVLDIALGFANSLQKSNEDG